MTSPPSKEECAKNLLSLGRESNTVFKTKSGATLSFARAEESDWERIKKLSKKDIIKEYLSLRSCVEHCCSVRDMQILMLLESEMSDRGYTEEDLDE